MKKIAVRMLSLLLCTAMLIGMFPGVTVYAAEDEPTEATVESAVPETTAPPAEPTETTVPAETTEPVETTQPEETTGPEETTQPEETTGPEETTQPVETAELENTPLLDDLLDSGTLGDNLTWELMTDGTLYIHGAGPMVDGSLSPWTEKWGEQLRCAVLDEGITSIGKKAFLKCSRLKSVVIPSTVTDIGWSAFEGCTDLTSVTLPDGLTTLGINAFAKTGLTSVTVPGSVTSFGESAFGNCENLASVTLEKGLTKIGIYAFQADNSLTSIVIPEGVTTIGVCAFFFCENLTTVTLPSTLTTIESSAFDPTGLSTVYYNGTRADRKNIVLNGWGHDELNSARWICSDTPANPCGEDAAWALDDSGVLTVSGSGPMWDWNDGKAPWIDAKNRITSVVIEEGITSVGKNAFSGYEALTSVSLPRTLTKLGSNSFSSSGLTSVTVPGSVTEWGSNVFDHCDRLASLTLEEGLTEVGSQAFQSCTALTSVVIPEGVTTLRSWAFGFCTKLTTVTLPMSLTKIESTALHAAFITDIYYAGTRADRENINIADIAELSTVRWHYAGVSDEQVCGDGVYWQLENGVLTVYGDGEMWDFNDDEPWSDLRSQITSIVIEEGVTTVGMAAFSKCSRAASVSIPDSVWHIGPNAFRYCTALTTVSIPEHVTEIGGYAFRNCSKLTEIFIPDSVKSVREGAFTGCTSLTKVRLPQDITVINMELFDGCVRLTEAPIPAGVTEIASAAFRDCAKLTGIQLPETLTTIGSYAFMGCAGLTELPLPAALTEIGSNAFSGCSGLTGMVIPEGIKSLGSSFYGGYTFENCSNLVSVTLPQSLSSIGYRTFAGCAKLKELVIPENVTTIGSSAFAGCKSLTSINIPEFVTEIESSTFSDCASLKSIQLPEGLRTIGYNAFRGCSSLMHIPLPESLRTIGSGSFGGCSSLRYITIPDGVTVIDDSVFSGCKSLSDVELPDCISSIGAGAFNDCTNLESITLPDGLTSIGRDAFYGCKSLTRITIPDSVSSIGRFAFACSRLTDVTVPGSVSTIEEYTFGECENLSSVTLGEGVASIDRSAFSNCPRLATVVLPKSLTSIGDYAFPRWESALKYVYYGGSEQDRSQISIGQENEGLDQARWLYNTDLSEVSFGSCGKNAEWEFHESTGLLRIFGTGDMNHFSDHAPAPWDNTKVRKVIIEYGITSIGAYAFDPTPELAPPRQPGGHYGSVLTNVSIPDSVNYIGTGAFQRCSSLTSVIIPGSVVFSQTPGVGYDGGSLIFSGCSSLTNVTIQEGIKVIPTHMFYLCNSLETISLPKSLTFVGMNAFCDCGSITDVYYGGTEKNRSAIKFNNDADYGEQWNMLLLNANWHYVSAGPVNTLTLDREFLILESGSESVTVRASAAPQSLGQLLSWHLEDENGQILPDDNGLISIRSDGAACTVTPQPDADGTAWLVAQIDTGDEILTARCRFDVTTVSMEEFVQYVKLGSTALTTELNQTECAKFQVLIGRDEISAYAMDGSAPTGSGIAITDAWLENEAAQDYFRLEVKDDSWIWVVPREDAPAAPAAKTYTSNVIIQVGDFTRNAGTIKLTVKKTVPKLKATALKFNSFLSSDPQRPTFTGGTVTIEEATLPGWLKLEDGVLDLNRENWEFLPGKKLSGTAELQVSVEGYRGTYAVKVPVSAAYTAPNVALAKTSVTVYQDRNQSLGIPMQLLSKQKGVSLSGLGISYISAEGYEDCSIDENGRFTLYPTEDPRSPVTLKVHFSASPYTKDLKLTIKASDVALKLAKTSITLNPTVDHMVKIPITATPADFDLQYPVIRVTANGIEDPDATLYYYYSEGALYIHSMSGITPSSTTYTFYISGREEGREAKLTVKTLDARKAAVSATLKASGAADLSFLKKHITVTPTFKNYDYNGEELVLTVTNKAGDTVTDLFIVEPVENGVFRLSPTSQLNPNDQYSVRMYAEIGGQEINTPAIRLSVKKTALAVKLAKTSVTLNPWLMDHVSIPVTSGTKGAPLPEQLDITIKEGSKVLTNGDQLNVTYSDGMLYVNTVDSDNYGKTYKVTVTIGEGHKAATLTVKTAKANTYPYASLKASGSLDVIRPRGKAITITPTVKNYTAVEDIEFIGTVRDSDWNDCSKDFVISPQRDGTFKLYPTKTAVVGQRYYFQLEGYVQCVEGWRMGISGNASFTVKMGSAKITADQKAVQLYARDTHSRSVITLSGTDRDLANIRLVEPKGDTPFTVTSLGGGQYAIGFKPGMTGTAKTGKLTLNVYLEGNNSSKPNTTVSVTVNVLR